MENIVVGGVYLVKELVKIHTGQWLKVSEGVTWWDAEASYVVVLGTDQLNNRIRIWYHSECTREDASWANRSDRYWVATPSFLVAVGHLQPITTIKIAVEEYKNLHFEHSDLEQDKNLLDVEKDEIESTLTELVTISKALLSARRVLDMSNLAVIDAAGEPVDLREKVTRFEEEVAQHRKRLTEVDVELGSIEDRYSSLTKRLKRWLVLDQLKDMLTDS